LIAAKATFALNVGLWLRRDRLDMFPPATRHQRRNQAGKPLIGLFRFAQPPLLECAPRTLLVDANTVSANAISRYLTNWKVETAIVSTVDAAEIACRNAVATGRPFDVVILDVKGLVSDRLNLPGRFAPFRA
jgi:hypothetical protein